jgi:hypothetical protein
VAENTSEQQDWVGADEATRNMRLSFKRAVFRIGISYVAQLAGLDETTLRNQIDWRPRNDGKGCWKPSADVVFIVFPRDPEFREEALGQCGERIAPLADLTPEDFMRQMVAKAIAGGFHPTDREEVLALSQRVKKGGTP